MGVWRNGVDALEARLAVLLGINVFREQARKPRARPLSQLSGVRTPGAPRGRTACLRTGKTEQREERRLPKNNLDI